MPAFWLNIQIGKVRIPLPILLIFPLFLLLEVLSLFPLVIVGIWKRKPFLVRLGTGFFISRLMFIFILHGRRFEVNVNDQEQHVRISGRLR